MSEEDLRIQQIKMKIKGLTFEQARDISNLCSEYYIEGLEQSRFDKRMLELELSGYRQAILQDKELMGLKEDKDKLQQENQQLKEVFEKSYTSEQLDFAVNEVKEELKAEKDITNNLHKTIDKLRVSLYETQQQRDLYKEVIEEVREEFKKSLYFFEQVITENNEMGFKKTEYKLVNSDNLLQILDKVKEISNE